MLVMTSTQDSGTTRIFFRFRHDNRFAQSLFVSSILRPESLRTAVLMCVFRVWSLHHIQLCFQFDHFAILAPGVTPIERPASLPFLWSLPSPLPFPFSLSSPIRTDPPPCRARPSRTRIPVHQTRHPQDVRRVHNRYRDAIWGHAGKGVVLPLYPPFSRSLVPLPGAD